MGDVTVLLLDDDDARHDAMRTAFLAAHPSTITVIVDGGGTEAATRACADITALDPEPPLVVAALGRTALTLPAVARSQRAHHRHVVEYVLLDPELPPVTDAWPDSRVVVACDVSAEAFLQARLRGWDLLRPEDVGDWRPPD